MEDDEYYFGFFYNDSSQLMVEESYVTSGEVILCEKTEVNGFGAALLPTLYSIIFVLSLVGNGLVLCIIYKYEKLSTVTNVFLLNLVISDLIFAFTLPFWAEYHRSEWIFGKAMCKLVGSFYSIGFNSSILFLTLMTFDRYLAVVHAIAAAQSRRIVYAFCSSAAVWFISILASVKDMFLFNVQNSSDGMLCEVTGHAQNIIQKWQLIGHYQQFLLFFTVPLLVVLYCYFRICIRIMSTRMAEKYRAVKLILFIVSFFFVCWTPYNMVILLQAIDMSFGDKSKCSNGLDYALYVTRNLAYMYCSISPVLYTFLGKKFQNHFLKLLAKHVPCLKMTVMSTQSSRTTSFRTPNTEYLARVTGSGSTGTF
ncbi:chemokine (C-C motif) receptor 12a [Triplophysa rosa]|uniref:C-C chemokine receptor type 3-like n=1 Tax=Triplophysa rosa TaxID=992332 RepID=A0A9W7WXB2_TRIRA|nr:chemokine (C-C motif) receptor 12a [Triplophysa rosa]KAI7809934.1 putative c-C chemokine receptor type 3-like [Triplophysa rosa]